MMPLADEPTDEPMELFPFLRLFARSLVRREMKGAMAAVALLVALESKGRTGAEATVNTAEISKALGISERQIWRHFTALTEGGWFQQTSKPSRGRDGGAGRRARYRLTRPHGNLSDDERLPLSHAEPSHDDGGTSDGSAPDRLTLPAGSSDASPPILGTVPPSVGSPSVGHPSRITPSGRRLTIVGVDLDDDDLTKIASATRGDHAHASAVAADILGRASGLVRNPVGYILQAIGDQPDRYRPTRRNVRSRDEECRVHAGEFRHHCRGCAADAKAAN